MFTSYYILLSTPLITIDNLTPVELDVYSAEYTTDNTLTPVELDVHQLLYSAEYTTDNT